MTWDEFVKYVNEELRKQESDGSVEIRYVDIALPSLDHELYIPDITVDNFGLTIKSVNE